MRSFIISIIIVAAFFCGSLYAYGSALVAAQKQSDIVGYCLADNFKTGSDIEHCLKSK